jgi:hypothetical protein
VNFFDFLDLNCEDFFGLIQRFTECGLLWILKTCNSDFCEFFGLFRLELCRLFRTDSKVYRVVCDLSGLLSTFGIFLVSKKTL